MRGETLSDLPDLVWRVVIAVVCFVITGKNKTKSTRRGNQLIQRYKKGPSF